MNWQVKPRIELRTDISGKKYVMVVDTPQWRVNPIKWLVWRHEVRKVRRAFAKMKVDASWRSPYDDA